MTLTSKFKKDISTLRAAANKEIYLDVEDPDADYATIIECIAEDLVGVV